jgi:hypothetical protein
LPILAETTLRQRGGASTWFTSFSALQFGHSLNIVDTIIGSNGQIAGLHAVYFKMTTTKGILTKGSTSR